MLHAVVRLCLLIAGNNFNLFEQLMMLYEKDPDKYPYLGLNCVDKVGNTLLHLASCMNYSKHSHKAVELLMSKDVPVDVKNKEGKMAIDYLKPHDRRTQYLRVAGKQSVAAATKKNETTKPQTSSPVPFDSQLGSLSGNGGDIEHTLTQKPKSDSSRVDSQGFKTKDAVGLLTSLVAGLSDLTPAEVKLAKSSKEKWLEVEKSSQKQSLSQSNDEEGEATPAAKAPAARDEDTQEADVEEEVEEEEEEEEKV